MKPYYQHGGATIYHGRTEEILPQLQGLGADIVVTSPPFNANMEYEVGEWASLDEYRNWLAICMTQLGAACASGAWVCCELADLHVSPEHSHASHGQKEQFNMATGAYLTVAMDKANWYYKGEVIWDRGRWMNNMAGRMACAPGSPALLTQHSKILFFRKPGGREGVYQFPEQSNSWKATWCRTIWSHVQPRSHPDHPAIMPLQMAMALIEGWSLPNSLILEPFMGTGTTLMAAKKLGRQSVGIDKSERYCEIAASRLSQEVMEFV